MQYCNVDDVLWKDDNNILSEEMHIAYCENEAGDLGKTKRKGQHVDRKITDEDLVFWRSNVYEYFVT